MKRGYYRCRRCKRDFVPHRLPLRLTVTQWRVLLASFVLEHSARLVASESRLHVQRVLRALQLVRAAMQRDVPKPFSGTVEVDETYLGGQWKNKPKQTRDAGTMRGRGTSKQPVFGILARRGIVWAEVVNDVQAATLMPLITGRVKRGVRRSRLPLYLAEYVWRYNHRNETNKNKAKQLLKLLKS